MTNLTLTITDTKENFIMLRNILSNTPKTEKVAHKTVSKIDLLLHPKPEAPLVKKPSILKEPESVTTDLKKKNK